jgi:hypothetical protein
MQSVKIVVAIKKIYIITIGIIEYWQSRKALELLTNLENYGKYFI